MSGFDTPLPTSSQFIITDTDGVVAAWERFEARKRRLDAFIEKAIERRNRMDGDPDLEPAGDELDGNDSEDDDIEHSEYDGLGCPVSDPDGPSTAEWHTLGRHKAAVLTSSLPPEDAEVDDDDTGVEDHPQGFDREEDRCGAGDDAVFGGAVIPDFYRGKYDGPGDAEDAEREQLPDDVPCLAVYSLEPNPFDGKREYLGHSNLQASFVSGRPMKAAD